VLKKKTGILKEDKKKGKAYFTGLTNIWKNIKHTVGVTPPSTSLGILPNFSFAAFHI